MNFSTVADRIMTMFSSEMPSFTAGLYKGTYHVMRNGEDTGVTRSTFETADRKADEMARDWAKARMVQIMQEESNPSNPTTGQ